MNYLKLIAMLAVLIIAALGILFVFDIITLENASETAVKTVEAAIIVLLAGLLVGALARSSK